ncbi:hypothetical protein JRQ81_003963 [Phrynocephalus forsythii]|uniref:Prostaglandin E synthase 3 n=1 Tax=Phrynocephalus forsythii TaxID=171643 RepID=A0A9Q0XLN9_9SAUR|nr:hypothetical protein JRQ81_003963 [Phrynocephalus forsythii]
MARNTPSPKPAKKRKTGSLSLKNVGAAMLRMRLKQLERLKKKDQTEREYARKMLVRMRRCGEGGIGWRRSFGGAGRTEKFSRERENVREGWQPASAKWYDRRDYVFIEFCVEDSKDVNVNFEKNKLTFSCLGGNDNFKHLNEIDLYNSIDPSESKHKRTDRSVLCCLRKGESGQSWPRLTKERAKLNWLSVDFNNWKDWEDDSDEDMSNFDRFSEMMNNMGGDEDVDLPEVDGADDDSPDSDDEKMPDLE